MKEETSTRGSDPFGGYVNRSLACHIYHTVKRQEESMDAKQTYYQNVSKTIINNLKRDRWKDTIVKRLQKQGS